MHKGELRMPILQSQKKATEKYLSKAYKRITVNVRTERVPDIENYIKTHQFDSVSSLFNAAVSYVINNDISLKPNKVVWTTESFEKFVELAELSEFETDVLKTRIEGITINNQAQMLGCSVSKINSAIYRIKLLYDACHIKYPEIFPPRRISEAEEYMDNN